MSAGTYSTAIGSASSTSCQTCASGEHCQLIVVAVVVVVVAVVVTAVGDDDKLLTTYVSVDLLSLGCDV